MMPGQIVLTRTPMTERSLAAGTVIPMIPPFDAEYASWPVWPSIPATDAVLMTTPRCPSASAGSVRAIAAAAIRIRLNVPIRLMSSTLRNVARLWGAPSRLTVRSAQPMPAQLTTARSGASLPPATAPAAARTGHLGESTAAPVVGTPIYDQRRTAAHHGPSHRGGAIKIYLEGAPV